MTLKKKKKTIYNRYHISVSGSFAYRSQVLFLLKKLWKPNLEGKMQISFERQKMPISTAQKKNGFEFAPEANKCCRRSGSHDHCICSSYLLRSCLNRKDRCKHAHTVPWTLEETKPTFLESQNPEVQIALSVQSLTTVSTSSKTCFWIRWAAASSESYCVFLKRIQVGLNYLQVHHLRIENPQTPLFRAHLDPPQTELKGFLRPTKI